MRQVQRGASPAVLQSISAKAQKAAAGGKPSSSVYAAPAVRAALGSLYREKCYLCEAGVSLGAEVEHFLPHTSYAPARAYDWKNLHLSCGDCNGRKRRKDFKVMDPSGKYVQTTLLIDPSDPKPAAVDALLRFNGSCDIEALPGPFSGDVVVGKTVEFLNDATPRCARMANAVELMSLVTEMECKSVWTTLIAMPALDTASWLGSNRTIYLDALSKAHRLYLGFLDDSRPFCVSARFVLSVRLQIESDSIRRLGRAWCDHNNTPLMY